MNTNILNRLSSNGTPLFKYERPTFNGFGFAEEPDERVKDAIEELVAKLKNGFIAAPNVNVGDIDALKQKKEELEDEENNGEEAAFDVWKDAIEAKRQTKLLLVDATTALSKLEATPIQLFDEKAFISATRRLDETKKRLINLEEETKESNTALTEAKNKIKRLEDLGKKPNRTKEEEAEFNQLTKAKKNIEKAIKDGETRELRLKQEIEKANDISEELDRLNTQKQEIAQAKQELESARDAKTNTEKAYIEAKADEEQAKIAYENIKSLNRENLAEVIRDIEENEIIKSKDYSDTFSFEMLPAKEETTFKDKIGSESELNNLFLLVCRKVENTRLSYNANLLLKQDLILEFIFLRTYYHDGLRDANAIFERITDENEGGMKYLYDYIIAKVVTQIIKDKKLK